MGVIVRKCIKSQMLKAQISKYIINTVYTTVTDIFPVFKERHKQY